MPTCRTRPSGESAAGVDQAIKERVKAWAREELSQGRTLSALDLWLEFQQQLEGEISRLKAQAADPEARKPFDESIAVLLEERLEHLRHRCDKRFAFELLFDDEELPVNLHLHHVGDKLASCKVAATDRSQTEARVLQAIWLECLDALPHRF